MICNGGKSDRRFGGRSRLKLQLSTLSRRGIFFDLLVLESNIWLLELAVEDEELDFVDKVGGDDDKGGSTPHKTRAAIFIIWVDEEQKKQK